MLVKYALFENNVTADLDDYMAVVQISDEAMGVTVQGVGRAWSVTTRSTVGRKMVRQDSRHAETRNRDAFG